MTTNVTGIGGSLTRAQPKQVKEYQIPIPPLEIQKKIAESLNKAQELIDKRKKQIKLLDEFLQSMFIDMFGDPIRNNRGWEVRELSNVLLNIDSGKSPICHEFPADDNNWGVLKLSAVTGGKYKSKENKQLPLENDISQQIEVRNKDLLITRKNTRELVGSCAYVFETRPKLLLSDTIFRLVTQNNVNRIYLWMLFNDNNFKRNIQALATGSAGSMPNISKTKLYSLPIPIPPLELQNRFASIVEATEKQRALMEQSLAEMENNFNSIMQRAFRGELFS